MFIRKYLIYLEFVVKELKGFEMERATQVFQYLHFCIVDVLYQRFFLEEKIVVKELKVDWLGNFGCSTPDAGTKETVKCGICGTQMNVERNILGATSFAESMGGRKHRYDNFTCLNLKKDWHKRILRLRMDVYMEEIDQDDPIGYEQKKKAAEKEILELLRANLK